jgi:4-hydroxy-tetrahydrodipicolinate reductase
MPLGIIVNGAAGRMGQAVIAATVEAGANVVAKIDAGDDLAGVITKGDVVIDFSSHAATRRVIELAVAARKALVIGTTGHPASERAELRALAARVPTVWAGNFSVGVNLLFHLVARAARALPADFDAEIVEMHHRFKKDAPSGTAARLAEIILDARKLGPDALAHGREGITGERPRAQVGMHALRGGDVVGDHTVMFATLGERIELTHKASDRAIFARGAVHAAQWIVKQPAGVYDMQDVLGLKD